MTLIKPFNIYIIFGLLLTVFLTWLKISRENDLLKKTIEPIFIFDNFVKTSDQQNILQSNSQFSELMNLEVKEIPQNSLTLKSTIQLDSIKNLPQRMTTVLEIRNAEDKPLEYSSQEILLSSNSSSFSKTFILNPEQLDPSNKIVFYLYNPSMQNFILSDYKITIGSFVKEKYLHDITHTFSTKEKDETVVEFMNLYEINESEKYKNVTALKVIVSELQQENTNELLFILDSRNTQGDLLRYSKYKLFPNTENEISISGLKELLNAESNTKFYLWCPSKNCNSKLKDVTFHFYR